ncbi:MAG TPA: choice-of-anchor D domain-containing protein [Casimicrobiaceae bacterium]|nr:choice-of-anchor D domain-containing protein [Casimicrobiaceae bacterium]
MSRLRFARGLVVVAALFASCLAHAAGRICTSADTLWFGQQQVGTTASSTVTVRNCGDAAFVFTDVSVHPATNAAFHVDAACRTGMSLAPGATCTIDVAFAPTLPGQASGAVWLHNTTSTPDQLVTFYGRGIDAQAGSASLVFDPPIVDFGAARIGVEVGPLVLALRNTGSAALVPSAFVLNGPTPYDFRGELGHGPSDCGIGQAIAAGDACTLKLYFHPQVAGARRAQLVVDAPQLAALAMSGIAGEGLDASRPAATIDVVEFHNGDDDQYFLTGDTREIALLDQGKLGAGWSRTGTSFKAWSVDATDAAAQPVCRFFGTPGIGPNSHFYTGYTRECDIVRKDPHWIEEGVTFKARLPMDGACASGERTVTRLFRPGASVTASRHRYVVDASLASAMEQQGWVLEGAVFCAPPG